MSLHEFVQLIKGHAGSEDSALRKSIAKSVLVHKDTVRPSEIAFKEIGGLAKAHDLPEVAEYFKNPSLEMILATFSILLRERLFLRQCGFFLVLVS